MCVNLTKLRGTQITYAILFVAPERIALEVLLPVMQKILLCVGGHHLSLLTPIMSPKRTGRERKVEGCVPLYWELSSLLYMSYFSGFDLS